jgi:hypothetical protein
MNDVREKFIRQHAPMTPMPPKGHCHPCGGHDDDENLHYTGKQINALLAMIPNKVDKGQLEAVKLKDVQYIGNVADESLLPEIAEGTAWALVGSLLDAAPYFYYMEGYVPEGYQAGWNDMSEILGHYDLLQNKASIFDLNLVAEYNISANQTQVASVSASHAWKPIGYAQDCPTYEDGKKYPIGACVNMEGDEEHSYRCIAVSDEAPYVEERTNRFTLMEAIEMTPQEFRVAGMKLTFVSRLTGDTETWIFMSGDAEEWLDEAQWKKVNFDAEKNSVTAENLYETDFDSPLLIAGRALADEFGMRFTEEYVRKEEVQEYLRSAMQHLFEEYPPKILDGYITPEMLSESTKQLIGSAEVTNLADEEDLTSRNNLLKLADRRYNPNASSGKGYVFLRKNFVNGVNKLAQEQLTDENTVYVVRYDFDLGGSTITLPAGCVLYFETGSVKNGSIDMNGGRVVSPFYDEESLGKVTLTNRG